MCRRSGVEGCDPAATHSAPTPHFFAVCCLALFAIDRSSTAARSLTRLYLLSLLRLARPTGWLLLPRSPLLFFPLAIIHVTIKMEEGGAHGGVAGGGFPRTIADKTLLWYDPLCVQHLRWLLSPVRWVSATNITQALWRRDSFSARLLFYSSALTKGATPALLP